MEDCIHYAASEPGVKSAGSATALPIKKEGFLFIYLQILTVIVEMIAAVPQRKNKQDKTFYPVYYFYFSPFTSLSFGHISQKAKWSY